MGGNISWLGTPRLLRTHYEKAGLTSGFKILDAQDQFRIDKSKFPIRKVQWFINNQKDEGIRVQDVDPGYNYFIKKSLEVFELYETHYQANDLIDFAPIEIIRLEQNYRSTANILNASNALIAHNANRMGKSLWTDAGNGELIDVYEAQTETDEVDYVTSSIQKLITDGASPSDCSILYRSNAQSRIFKEALIKYNIPYIIYGSLRFFERSEIKDALGYLRLIENSADNVAFERVVNFQTRSIGNATVEKIRTFTQDNHTSLFQAAIQISSTLPTLAANVLNGFTNLIEQMTDDTKHLDLSEKVANLLNTSGLMMHYSNDKTDKAGSKKENLEELITAAQPYNHTTIQPYNHEQDSEMNEVVGFISLASLDSSGDTNAPINQNIQLMTIHSAKGLDFPYVFLVDTEEDLFPSRQSKDEPHLMDEERRLCYVGMTRAMKKLPLSYAIKRFLHGQSLYAYPSRFLDEILSEYLNKIKAKFGATIQNYNDDDTFNQGITPKSDGQLSISALVKHAKFGVGMVLNFKGQGDSDRGTNKI